LKPPEPIDAQLVIDALERGENQSSAARVLGISRASVRTAMGRASRLGLVPTPAVPAGAFALVLTEIAPQRANALLGRGYAYGQSRVICGVHWQSDVEAGRVVAAATVARLHADPVFRAQLDAAREEVTRGLSRSTSPQASCAAEAAALAR
jgi:hypothetical protein